MTISPLFHPPSRKPETQQSKSEGQDNQNHKSQQDFPLTVKEFCEHGNWHDSHTRERQADDHAHRRPENRQPESLARLIHGGIEFLAEYGAHPFDTAHHSGSDRG